VVFLVTYFIFFSACMSDFYVTMVSQAPSKDSSLNKNECKELKVSKPQTKPSKKMKFVSSAETEPGSTTTFSEEPKSSCGINTMPRVVKRKLQKIKPVIEYNKRGKPYGPAHTEMQSYIGVLARSRVPIVDKKWTEIPKDVKEQFWEAIDMAYVVGQGGKKMVLSSISKKWKDFKSTLTRHHILPFINEKEKLRQPPELYKFIEKVDWDAFVASRLSEKFESVHAEQAQRREKCEYNHRLSRKGYVGLEDDLEESMPGVEIDRSTLWKKAREDKHSNIPDPKVAEKAKLIDELQNQVSEGTLTVSGSNDVLTMALGLEHPWRVRGVGAGISTRQYFNLPRQQRVKFADQLKESVRDVLKEETLKMEAKQLVEFERENLRNQLHQLIPNFDPSMLKLTTFQGPEQSPKNPMLDKASCFGALDVKALNFEDDNAKDGEKQEEMKDKCLDVSEKEQQAPDYSNLVLPYSLQALCRYMEMTLKVHEKAMIFTIEKEVFGFERRTFILIEDITQFAAMDEIGAIVVAVYMSGNWVRSFQTVYVLYPLPGNLVVDEECKNIVRTAIKMYNSHIGRQGHKTPIWKTLQGTLMQPNSVECGYYVMCFMRDIITVPSLEFEKKFEKGKDQAPYPQEAIEEVRKEWADFVCLHTEYRFFYKQL
ncbi:unnamed protein product, partial [Prunus brigantina]